jgi:transposase
MRYGYRRITVLLRPEGWHVNVKRAHRLYRLEGLQMRLKPPRRLGSRRRRWTASEKVRIVEERFEPGMTVSLVARRHGVAPNQLFTWRRLVAQGALTAAGSGQEVVPASDYRALQSQVRELQRPLGKKTLEAEILKEDCGRVGSRVSRASC